MVRTARRCLKILCLSGLTVSATRSDSCIPDISCSPLNDQLASEICKTKPVIAQKVIRLCDLNQIENLKQDNLKTIVLFRDPRGIYSSRKHLQADARFSAAETTKSVG